MYSNEKTFVKNLLQQKYDMFSKSLKVYRNDHFIHYVFLREERKEARDC